MQVLDIEIGSDREELITRLWELGTAGLIETNNSLQAFFPDGVDLSQLSGTYNCTAVLSEDFPSEKSSIAAEVVDPTHVGKSFFIVPSSSRSAAPLGRIRIDIDAQDAFGSGSHESTQLVIEALEKHFRPGSVLLDVGSGSGVVSAVAGHLGPKRVFACDTHMNAVSLTRRHAPGAHVFAGSVDAVASSIADVVVANISARVIDELSFHLNRVMKPDGLLILSGFIAEKIPQFIRPAHESSSGDWLCWVCKPADMVHGADELPQTSLQPFPSEWW